MYPLVVGVLDADDRAECASAELAQCLENDRVELVVCTCEISFGAGTRCKADPMGIVPMVGVTESCARRGSMGRAELVGGAVQVLSAELLETLVVEQGAVERNKADATADVGREVEWRQQLVFAENVDGQADGCRVAQEFTA